MNASVRRPFATATPNTAAMFRNHYLCPRCLNEWEEDWPVIDSDYCHRCGTRAISPYYSDRLDASWEES